MGNRNSSGQPRTTSALSKGQILQHLSMDHMITLLSELRKINQQKTLKMAIHKTIEATTSLLGCDRATMFIVDEITDELVIQDSSNSIAVIRIPSNVGE